MKKQIALFLLTSIAIPTAPILAMDKSKKPQPQIGNLKNENTSSICNSCGKNPNNNNNCIKCKNLCESCNKHNQKLEEAKSYREDLGAKAFIGIATVFLGFIIYKCK